MSLDVKQLLTSFNAIGYQTADHSTIKTVKT